MTLQRDARVVVRASGSPSMSDEKLSDKVGRHGMAKETPKGQEREPTRLTLRLHPEEMRYVRNAAKTAGKTLSDYVRERLLIEYLPDPLGTISATPGKISAEPSMDDVSGRGFSSAAELRPETSRGGNLSTPTVCVRKLAGGSAIERAVCERTGHAKKCRCFGCQRLRELLLASLKSPVGTPAVTAP